MPVTFLHSLMYEIWIEESGKELHRQTLSTGQFNLGRSKDNQIYVPYSGVSRQHLRLDVGENGVMVTDLGSTNGTRLNGQSLQPHQATSWPLQERLQVGGLTIHIKPIIPKVVKPLAKEEASSPQIDKSAASIPETGMALTVVSVEATPQLTVLTAEPIIVGRDRNCAIRLAAANVAARHCLLQFDGRRVEVTNMDAYQPAELSGTPLEVGQPTEWPINESLKVGDAQLYLTLRPANQQVYSSDLGSGNYRRSRHILRHPIILLLLTGFGFLCLVAFAVLVVQAARCGAFNAGCLMVPFGSVVPGGESILVQGKATPTLAPVVTNPVGPTSVPTVEFDIGAPTPTSVPVDCAPDTSSGTGWLELPFPYRGTEPIFGGSAEDFRRISQRSRFGGRINSFFDHEFPVYPAIFGGYEPDDKDQTLIVFNGTRSDDAYSQDSDSADWYSGHAGIDFAAADPRQPTTPVLAAADGRLLLAKIDADDNHMVWLEHDPDGDGRYQYATYYFHLLHDEIFLAMTNMEEGTPIQAGQRIGTMGTTGRSSGIHLHFEVRYDVNGDRQFSIFERVDPYGWFPSQEIVDDPWAVLASWVDNQGESHKHEGIKSEYLWVHPLVDVVDTSGECQQVTNVKVDLYNVLGWAVVDPGFTYIARDDQGQILEVGQPHRRTITILEEELEGVDRSTISLEWLNPKLDTWFTYKKAELEPNASGGYTFSAIVDKTGRYVLVAKEVFDRVPPTTSIELSGARIGDEIFSFQDSVTITLVPSDRGLIQSEIVDVQYSLDCGQSWNEYSEPFEVTLNTPHTCGEAGAESATIELGENDFLLLAMSEDSENNIEQPPAQIRFRVE